MSRLRDVLGPPPGDLGELLPTHILESVVLRILARIIHADGIIDPRELELLHEVASTLELGPEEATRILHDELTRQSDPAELARQIPSPELRHRVYSLACLMARNDGSVAPPEKEILDAFAAAAGIDQVTATAILDEIVSA